MQTKITMLMVACVWLCCMLSSFVSAQEAAYRVWEDASGRFQVRATLIEKTGTEVRLRTADGREITVPIEKLSQADQRYLQSPDEPDENPFAGGQTAGSSERSDATMTRPGAVQPPGTSAASPSVGPEMALPDTGNTVDLAGVVAGRFQPDGPGPKISLPDAVVLVSSIDAYDKVSTPILASSDGFLTFVSIGRNMSGRPDETRGRIYAVNLSDGRAQNVWDKAAAVRVLDHDPVSGQTLLIDQLDQFHRGGELVMVEGLATGSPRELYRRTLPGAGRPGFAPQVQWAKLLPNGVALAIVNDTLHLWDLPAARLIYRIERVGSSPPPALSPNERYLAIPITGGATIVETATGQLCGNATMGGLLKPGLAFHPEGKQLLMCVGNRYVVWDCMDKTAVYEATTTEHLGAHPLHWIGPKMFRTQLGVLVHVDLGMAIWKYTTSGTSEPLAVDGNLLLATTSQLCSVVSISLPHDPAETSLRELMAAGDAAMLIRPGSQVAVSIETSVDGVDRRQIESSLAEAIDRAGWKVNSRAPITLVASIGRGEPQQLQYRSMGQPLQSGVSTATLNPFTARLEIRRGTDVLWQRETTNHVPSMLRLEEGETVQDAVTRYEKPNPEFFAMLNLPPRIPKPEVAAQIGSSSLNKGAWRDISRRALPPTGPRPR